LLQYVGVVKRYGGVVAVDGVTISFDPGRIYCLLGPNGSGKSTLMKMSIGLVRPDEGRVSVDGVDPSEDPVAARMLVGFCPEEVVLYESLTPAELASFLASVYRIPAEEAEERVGFLAKILGLEDQMGRVIGELSHGNRRKVQLMASLIHDPRVLVLDEPFSGLDPRSAILLRELMRRYASEGRTVLFSTHVLQLAEAVADEVVIMRRGRVAGRGTVSDLRERLAAADLEEVFLEVSGLSSEVRELVEALWEAVDSSSLRDG